MAWAQGGSVGQNELLSLGSFQPCVSVAPLYHAVFKRKIALSDVCHIRTKYSHRTGAVGLLSLFLSSGGKRSPKETWTFLHLSPPCWSYSHKIIIAFEASITFLPCFQSCSPSFVYRHCLAFLQVILSEEMPACVPAANYLHFALFGNKLLRGGLSNSCSEQGGSLHSATAFKQPALIIMTIREQGACWCKLTSSELWLPAEQLPMWKPWFPSSWRGRDKAKSRTGTLLFFPPNQLLME